MQTKSETIQKIITSMRKNRAKNHFYSDTSTVENKSNQIGVSCEEVSYIVEWQMHDNPQKEYNTVFS